MDESLRQDVTQSFAQIGENKGRRSFSGEELFCWLRVKLGAEHVRSAFQRTDYTSSLR